ncbi:hypothetical protein PTKIN_Ptkin01aG0387700 [Pterospermum kingtungense]
MSAPSTPQQGDRFGRFSPAVSGIIITDPSWAYPAVLSAFWDANTEELVYENATLTDPEAVMGWHMLTDTIGRVRSDESGIGGGMYRFEVYGFGLKKLGVSIA